MLMRARARSSSARAAARVCWKLGRRFSWPLLRRHEAGMVGGPRRQTARRDRIDGRAGHGGWFRSGKDW